MVVPSFIAVLNIMLAAAIRDGMFCTMIVGLPGMCRPR